jgi:uncharacterized integral membrane protein (TIGR00698 family)
MKKLIPGLLLAVVIGLLAKMTAVYIPGPGSIFFAILIGLIFGNILPPSERTESGLAFAEKSILPIAIALMGTELELHALSRLGISSLLIVLPAMTFSVFCALLIGRFLKLSASASLMLGIGNSVCGSSAILAAAPAVKAEKRDVAVAIAAVNLMGTLGMFLLPGLAVLLTLSDIKTSYLIGGSLQAVGQVVAAGFSVSDTIGNNALVIKMLRVLMIGPIVMILHLIFHSKGAAPGQKKKYVPGYIIGFMLFALAASIFHNDTLILPHIKALAKLLMVIAMAAVGFRIRIRSLLAQGPRAVLLVVVLSIIQTSAVLLLIATLI